MKTKAYTIGVFLFLLLPFCSEAQTQLSVTYFQNNIQLFNPAYVGTEDHINVSLFNRRQWLNTPGSPSLQGVSGHIPFSYERLGAGVNILKEETATVQSLYFNANGSYKINFKKGRLSFGLRLGILQRNENLDGLVVKDKDDVLLTNSSQFMPEVGGGFFYKQKNIYTGLSFIRSAGIYLESDTGFKNYYHFILGGSQKISERFTLMPAFRLEYTGAFNPYAILILPVRYDEWCSIGAGYSTTSVLSLVASLHIDKVLGTTSNKYMLSYSYGQSLSKLTNYIGNTHELILTLKLVPAEKVDKILKRKVTVSPLFFD